MSDADVTRIENVRVVFACATCGALLSVDNHREMGCTCPNCDASYDLVTGDINLIRLRKGRAPTQWQSNGWDGGAK